jgi:DNA mismatch repair protein MutS2
VVDAHDVQDGVPASTDARTPSAVLEALELPAVLEQVAAHAKGPLGASRVRARRPSADAAWVALELARVDELARLLREGRGLVPEPVPPIEGVLGRLRLEGSVLEGGELAALHRTITAARLVLGELRRVAGDAPRVAELARPVPDRPVERRLELALDPEGQLLDSASPALARARSEVRQARDRLVQRLDAILRQIGAEGGVTIREGRYVIPVPRELRRRPDGIIHGESASGATLFLEPTEAIPLGNALREAEAQADREALKVLRDLTGLLRPLADVIADAHEMCVAVDDLAARAAYAVQVAGHRPEVVSAPGEIRLVAARHPLLLARQGGGRVVPFDLALEPGERTVILSGPNAGGKSVLLKAVGLVSLLAQCGVIPPVGPGTRIPIFRRIFADIGDRQSIAESLSTFSAHLVLLREVLEAADPATLVLLDEIGAGTDPSEGAALAGATLLALTRRGATTLATTHLGALKELAGREPGIVNASLQFDAATLQPTYHFVKGIPGRSYGLAIARRLGLPPAVLAEAESRVPEAERSLDALLARVEQRAREQTAREEVLEALEARLAAERGELDRRSEALAERARELARRERELDREARSGVRKYLLEARDLVEQAIAQAREARDEAAARAARRMVEEAVASVREGGERWGRETPAPAPPPALAPGDPVRLDSGVRGEVLELRGEEAVVQVGSLRVVVPLGSVTAVGGGGARAPGRAGPPTRHPPDASGLPAAEAPVPLEIDLRGLTSDEAEQTVLAAIDAAVMADQPFLRIIHGKGTGAVRDRVQQVVRRDRRVKAHSFAPPAQGGTGVTLVEFV